MIKFNRLILVILMLAWHTASATPISDMKLVGKAKLEVFFFDVYESQLYSPDGSYQAKRYPVALNIKYLREIDSEELLEQTEKEWQQLGVDQREIEAYLAELSGIWPDVSENDELTFVASTPDSGEFYFNKKSIGNVSKQQFASQFLAIWLDAKSSRPKLREKLIGGTE